ncbi:MAG: urease accessory protein UreD [Rhizobiaceae bacterium]|nr:urease accessory protein UreD [Rhizobiaceae bacterium]MCV0405153.1 urease accessory protein UreD [Rhizobiaceae bacterium]
MNAPLRTPPPQDAEAARLRSQRVAASGSIMAEWRDGRSRLARLRQEGAAKIRLPRLASGPMEAVLINTAGGLTGGDRLTWHVEASAGAAVTATTQACEKIYRSSEGRAEVSATVAAGEGASVAWLPQETILFDRSALTRRLEAELAPGARGLFVEAAIFGRRAMGETAATVSFRDRWRIRAGGRLVHAEEFAIGPEAGETLAQRAVAGGKTAVATVLLVGEDAEQHLDAARAASGDAGGASFWRIAGTGKLLARILAEDGYALRLRLVPLLSLLNGEAGLPKVWSL